MAGKATKHKKCKKAVKRALNQPKARPCKALRTQSSGSGLAKWKKQ